VDNSFIITEECDSFFGFNINIYTNFNINILENYE